MLRERKKKERKMKGRRLKRRREIGKRENCEEREKRKEYLIQSVFRFEYLGGCLVALLWVAVVVGGCRGCIASGGLLLLLVIAVAVGLVLQCWVW